MCGISGVYIFPDAKVDQVTPDLIDAMRQTLVHRGPDGGRTWISPDRRVGLGFRRLAIVDLSDEAMQPMSNETGTIWLVYNGEVYNHMRLRRELEASGHVFRTDHSDSEVLIHGYEEWGIDGLLSRIEGMFAFAIWDGNARTLYLVRDRIGIKPIYFSFLNGCVLFGSEIKAILAHPQATRGLDPIAMYHYLTFLTTPAPLTMFEGIYKLPAGWYLHVDSTGRMSARRYWDAVPDPAIHAEAATLAPRDREAFYVRGIRERLAAAVEKRLMSDVPFGVFLSGGIDSSAITALMAGVMDRPVDTFTVGFTDHTHLNEIDSARFVAGLFKTNHHEVMIGERDMVGYLDDLIYHQDEPIADWVCIPLYFVSRLVRESGTIMVLVGEGSDEQFCGYGSYMRYLELHRKYWTPFRTYFPKSVQYAVAGLAGALAKFRPGLEFYSDIIERAARDREHFWSGATVFFDTMKRQLVPDPAVLITGDSCPNLDENLLPRSYLGPDTFNVIRSFQEGFVRACPGADVLARMTYNEFKLRLPELLLMRVDKITMSTSVEARVPFLDHHLVEFTMGIAMEYKIRNGTPKYLLKRACEGLLPPEVIHQPKRGFGAPMRQWLEGEFGRVAENTVMTSVLRRYGFFDYSYVERLFREHRERRRDTSLYLWTLYNLTAWFDYWIKQ
jgi:asparagine synthase (glutamine-hydrolysing)